MKPTNLFGEEVVIDKRSRRAPQPQKTTDPGRSLEPKQPDCVEENTIQKMLRLSRIKSTIDAKKDEEEIAQVISKFKISEDQINQATELLKRKMNLSVIQALSKIIFGDCLELQFKMGEEMFYENRRRPSREASTRPERTHFPPGRRNIIS
jgi:hypothetical protein